MLQGLGVHCRALGSITGPRASGSWPTPVPSSSHPRRTRGEVRGRSRKAQVLTRDGDESCRPLQVRQRERHSVYRRGVRPYQQVQCQVFPPAPPARAGGLPISIRSETAGSWEQCSQSSSQRASKCVWITASLGLDTWVLSPEINTSREGKQGGGGMNMGHV